MPTLTDANSIAELAALLDQAGKPDLARQLRTHIADHRANGTPLRVTYKASWTLQKFVGDRQPGDEPFEVVRITEGYGEADGVTVVERRPANVDACNYAPHPYHGSPGRAEDQR